MSCEDYVVLLVDERNMMLRIVGMTTVSQSILSLCFEINAMVTESV